MCSLRRKGASFLGGLLELGLAVGESDVELLCALDNVLSLESGDVLGDFTAVGSVVHQQQLNVLLIAEEEFSESIRQNVTSLFSRTITNAG